MISSFITHMAGIVSVGFLPYVFNFILLPVYSQYLTAEDFGIIGLSLAAVAIASSWSSLQIPSSITRLYYDFSGPEAKRFLGSVLFSVMIVASFFVFLYLVLSAEIAAGLFGDSEGVLFVFCASMILLFNCLNTAFERVLIINGLGAKSFARGLFGNVIMTAAGVYLICYEEVGVIGYLISQLFYYISMSVFSFIVTRCYVAYCFEKEYFFLGLRYSLPLVLHAVAAATFMYIGSFFIQEIISLAAVGAFFIVDRISQVLKNFINALNSVLQPLFNKACVESPESGNEFFVIVMRMWIIVMLPISVAFAVFSQKFIGVFFDSQYGDVFIPLLFLSFAYILRGLYCFVSAPLFFGKKTTTVAWVTVMSGVISLPANYLLISDFGVEGACLSIALGFLINAVASHYLAKSVFRLHFIDFEFLAFLSLGVALSAFLYVVVDGLSVYWVPVVTLIFVAFVLFSVLFFDVTGVRKGISVIKRLL